LHILRRPEAEVEALAQALIEAKQQVGMCSVCFHLSAEPVCDICRSPSRDSSTICVVSDSRDVIALERTREYPGKYHVLGGLISPMDGIGPDQLNITPLDSSTICVVSDSRDVIALERTREYPGKYHVLGGLISPMDGIGPDQLNITPLVRRVSQQDIKEVIMAISPSVEGETTTLYVGQLIKPFTKVTRIAFGLPMGGDLEYADEVTLARALEGRREL